MDEAIKIVFDILGEKYWKYVWEFNNPSKKDDERNWTDNLIIKDFRMLKQIIMATAQNSEVLRTTD